MNILLACKYNVSSACQFLLTVQYANSPPLDSPMFLDEFEPLYEVSSNELAQVYVAKRYNNGREVTVKVSYYSAVIWKKAVTTKT